MSQPYPELSRYIIDRPLASGGMGTIYIAQHKKLGHQVALKVPHKFNASNQLARFLQEGRILAQLNHPNIVRVLDADVENGIAFLAMDLIEGQNLEDLNQKRLISIKDAVSWAIQIADALSHIHELQMLHRDIKNENILINKRGQAILVDFGIAKNEAVPSITTDDYHVLGTFRYSSPELFNNDPLTDKSDVYSLGIVLYRCLTGTYPYDGQTPQSFYKNFIDGTHTPACHINNQVPKWLSDIIDTCLEKETKDRWDSSNALKKALLTGFSRQWPSHNKPFSPLNETMAEMPRPPSSSSSPLLNNVTLGEYLPPTSQAGLESERFQTDEMMPSGFNTTIPEFRFEPKSEHHLHPTEEVLNAPKTSVDSQKSKHSLQNILNTLRTRVKPSIAVMGVACLIIVVILLLPDKKEIQTTPPPTTISVPAPIMSLREAQDIKDLRSALIEHRSGGVLTFSENPSTFSQPESCYVVIYNTAGVTAILLPEDQNGNRLEALSQEVKTKSYFAEANSWWVYLF